MQHWSVGNWVMFAISAFLALAGLYQLVFAARLEARDEARREAQGDHDGGGYRPSLSPGSPRVTGMIFLGVGAFGIYRMLGPV